MYVSSKLEFGYLTESMSLPEAGLMRPGWGLLREVHAAEEGVEAGVGVQVVEKG